MSVPDQPQTSAPGGAGHHRQETLKLLADISIPSQPGIVRALIDERAKSEPDWQRIVGLIGADVGLAAAVLKSVNSPYYSLRKPHASIPQAITFLGMEQVNTLVMGLALRASFGAQGAQPFWDNPIFLCCPASQAKRGRGKPGGEGFFGLAERILLTM